MKLPHLNGHHSVLVLIIAALLVGALFCAFRAHSAELGTINLLCLKGDEMHAILDKTLRQHKSAQGVTNNGKLMQLYTDGDRWTLLLTLPSAETCLLAEGSAWVPVVEARGGL